MENWSRSRPIRDFKGDIPVFIGAALVLLGGWLLFPSGDRLSDRMAQFGTLACRADAAEYGVVIDHQDASPRDQITVLAIPNTVRNPGHYEADCRPLKQGVPRDRLSAAAIRPARSPSLSFMLQAGFLRGDAATRPLLRPGERIEDSRRILILLRNESGQTAVRSTIKAGRQMILRARGPGSHRTSPDQGEIETTAGRRALYSGVLEEARAGQAETLYFAECDESRLCQLIGSIDYAENGLAGPLHGLTLEIWLDEDLMPQARDLLRQATALLRGVATVRRWQG